MVSKYLFMCGLWVQVLAQDHASKVQLMHHSFSSPLNKDTSINDWHLLQSTVPTDESVVLIPAVAGRTGILWSKFPMHTPEFEVELSFVFGGAASGREARGLALWYVAEDMASSPPAADWNLFGYRNNFNGLAVFFSATDRAGKLHPSISVATNDGSRAWSQEEIPSNNGLYYDFRSTSAPMRFTLLVNVTHLRGVAKMDSAEAKWVDCFTIPAPALPSNGFLGVSGAGSAFPPASDGLPYDRIDVRSLTTYNRDPSRVGEDGGDHIAAAQQLLNKVQEHHENKDIGMTLTQLSQMLYQHVSESAPREQQILRIVSTLANANSKLMNDVRELQRTVERLAGLNHSESIGKLNNELSGIRSLFHSHSKTQQNVEKSLGYLSQKIGTNNAAAEPSDVRVLAEQSANLERTLTRQTSINHFMLVLLILAVAGFAYFMFRRMKDMEKKHFL